MVPGPEDGEGEAGAGADGEVAQPRGSRGEAVQALEDEGEGLEGHVEDGVDEGQVGAGGGHDGLRDDHADGAGADHGQELAQVGALQVAGGHDGRGRGRMVGSLSFVVLMLLLLLGAEARGAAGEEDGSESFWEEEGGREGQGADDGGDVEGPSPAYGGGTVAREYGCQ